MYEKMEGVLIQSRRFSENLKESQRKALTQMDVRAMKHAAKLAEWSERVQACRTSGLPVRVWCEQNNVTSSQKKRQRKPSAVGGAAEGVGDAEPVHNFL